MGDEHLRSHTGTDARAAISSAEILGIPVDGRRLPKGPFKSVPIPHSSHGYAGRLLSGVYDGSPSPPQLGAHGRRLAGRRLGSGVVTGEVFQCICQ